MHFAVLELKCFLVPVQITEHSNNLSLSEDSNEGIELHLELTADTAAEIIHVDVTCIATIAVIIQSKIETT